ncbi:MAG: YrhB domain-containing protein [Pseudomonadota bacterium]
MLTIDEGRKIAADYLRQLSDDLELYNNPIHEGCYGWVFAFQSRKFIQTGHFSDQLAGNAPLLLDRHTEKLHALGTADTVEFYVKNYVEFGDPFKRPGRFVEVSSCREGADKASAIREIRQYSEIGLTDAKVAIDKCLSGERQVIECRTLADAEHLVSNLSELGISAAQLGE